MAKITQTNNAEPSETPSAGSTIIYVDSSTKKLATKDDAGTVTAYGSGGGGGSTSQVKVSANDTTENYLENKIVAGTGVSIVTLNDGADETLEISNTLIERNPINDLDYFDDFICVGGLSAQGPLSWQGASSGTGTSTLSAPSVANRPGVQRLMAGTAAQASYAGIYTGFSSNSTNASFLFSSTTVHRVRTYMYINDVNDALGSYVLWSGFGDTNNTSNVRNGAYLYQESNLHTNWQFVTADRGTRTTTNTGVTVAVGWNLFDILIQDVSGTLTATLKINDVLAATNTTNIPTTSGEGFGLINRIRKTDAVATIRYIDIDWAWPQISMVDRS